MPDSATPKIYSTDQVLTLRNSPETIRTTIWGPIVKTFKLTLHMTTRHFNSSNSFVCEPGSSWLRYASPIKSCPSIRSLHKTVQCWQLQNSLRLYHAPLSLLRRTNCSWVGSHIKKAGNSTSNSFQWFTISFLTPSLSFYPDCHFPVQSSEMPPTSLIVLIEG